MTKEFKNGEFGPDLTCDFVVNFIDEHKDEPFFVYYPMILTHCPFVPTPDSEEWDVKRSTTYNGDNGTEQRVTSMFRGEPYQGG